ncbi:DUF4153 domain-containing protein [Paenibacillus sp. R14(2021)]|uniref:DUF4153 domain-containing protein n=1 Tax=Paenibacillus sp. R14(2021) TaxID=2859228 RepID=UPI001C615976|nr:DUF4173 domain-containing protein [Paenibacillus sp. R14(2021)]
MRDPAPWQRKYENMALLSLLFGLWSQYLFVWNGLNLSVPLFVAAFYGLFFYAVKGRIGGFDQWKGQSKSGWLLSLPVVLLSLTYMIYANELFRALNVILLPALIAAQTVLLTRSSGKPWYRAGFYGDVLLLSLFKPFSHIFVPFGLLANRLTPKNAVEQGMVGKAKRILFGLLLAAPLLGLVIGLLASADRIFNELLWRIPRLLFHWDLFGGFIRTFVGAVFALYAFSYLWALLFRRIGDHQVGTHDTWNGLALVVYEEKAKTYKLDPLTASTLLISFNLVYIVFAVIQFSYLFGASKGMLPAGSVYAEYARQGFAQLIAVSLINLILLLCGLHLVKQGERAAELVRKFSLSMLVGCTLVMLISAFGRLSLYEQVYGYTQTRLLVHGFMILLCFILAASIIRIWRSYFSLAKAYIALGLTAYIVMNYADLDGMIARQNSERYEQNGKIDTRYLSHLSTDALPALLKLQERHPRPIPNLEDAIRSIRDQAPTGSGWPSWNLSKSRAAALEQPGQASNG